MAPNKHKLEILWACGDGEPLEVDMIRWANAAMDEVAEVPSEVSLKVVSIEEMTALNSAYRGKKDATNVLSFPLNVAGDDDFLILGDLAICLDVVKAEARDQNKTMSAHFAHLLVHGVLHLAGYDHQNDADAQEMEAIETHILAALDISAPYEIGIK
ncbi:MAG: putative rRNA maturation factor [Flavobacterium sp.]|jgi:probable rRNA maturation factor